MTSIDVPGRDALVRYGVGVLLGAALAGLGLSATGVTQSVSAPDPQLRSEVREIRASVERLTETVGRLEGRLEVLISSGR